MADRRTAIRRTVIVGGVTLALSSPVLMDFLNLWEDGGTKVPVEGSRVYADKLAGGLPTACNGITKHVSPVPVIVGEYWSQEKCEEVGRQVTASGQIDLAKCIRVPVSQNTFDAFSSHGHNFGNARTCASRALELVNLGQREEGCRAIAYGPNGEHVWASAGGVYYRGLHNRRKAEMALCLKQ